ncbi:MAG TPA: BamA/TamA family outer membrane protein [Gemmatimonadaceae bacterium]
MPNRISKLVVLAGLLIASEAVSAQRMRGVEVSGLPALNFDADEGFGYGVILALYGYEPGRSTYAWTLQPTVFLTTEGRRDYTAFFDAPSSANHAWRKTFFVGHEQQLATPYYGTGNTTPYDSSLEHGSTRYFYRYGRTRDRAALDLQHALGHPSVRALVGGGLSRDALDLTPFDSGTTLVQNELHGVTPAKAHTNYLRAGITWDTRDREIGTQSGTWADLLVQRVDKALGASNSYTRVTTTVRHYQPIGARLTLANRLLVQNTSGAAPFYVLSEIQTSQKNQDGLGGSSSVRGLPKNRYMGKGLLVSNNELRWRAAEFDLLGRQSSLIVSGFVDAGRVWERGLELSSTLEELHAGYGGGVRLGFGSSFVIAVDAAHSAQSTAPIYIGLGYMF